MNDETIEAYPHYSGPETRPRGWGQNLAPQNRIHTILVIIKCHDSRVHTTTFVQTNKVTRVMRVEARRLFHRM